MSVPVVRGQEQAPADSSLRRTLPEVVVTGSRTLGLIDRTAASAIVLEQKTLEGLRGLTVDAALTRETAAYIRDIGSGAGIKTVGLRGSSASETLILLNGVRLNSAQNGLVDLGLYPLELFQRIEIVRGGQSAAFGSDAIGGSINLVTRETGAEDRLGLNVTGGSFGQLGGAVDAGHAWKEGSVAIRGGYDRSDGRFPYEVKDGSSTITGVREGSSSRRRYGLFDLSVRPAQSSEVTATFLGVSADRGSPGPVTASGSAQARLADDAGNAIVRATYALSNGIVEGGVFGGLQIERFRDPSAEGGIDETYRNRNVGIWLQWSGEVNDQLSVITALEGNRASVESKVFVNGTGRSFGGVLLGARWTPLHAGVSIIPTIRCDSYSIVQPRWIWKLAVLMQLDDAGHVTLRGTAGTNYRVPSFNELYWIPGGNPYLRSEAGYSMDAGIDALFTGLGEHRLSITAFSNKIRDRIVGFPPLNVTDSRAMGIEAGWRWQPMPDVRIHGEMTGIRAESLEPSFKGRQLPFQPRLSAGGGVILDVLGMSVNSGVNYVSRRYTTLDNLEAHSVDPFAVVHCSISRSGIFQGHSVQVLLAVENIFDKQYQIVTGYPMPGRAIRSSVAFRLFEAHHSED
ncbi:MAG: hypothetical protein A2X67_02090 [Ignavibacteria bacterium GWA2_55_11]|nr:MAG: hypothetical protein A2X67_02090 [Ignavibacteria bacterium GWA2_55_11]OGU73103.1 MAG: hypothetical protein A3G43_04005 [Ignavibacteria bacterium RIFCSPLOWO2_12_FULL_56_21]